MPMGLLYIKSNVLYFFVYYIFGYRKKVVFENLALVFPEKSLVERTKIAKSFYSHLCDLIFETIKNLTISEKEITQRFQFKNLELLDELYHKG